MRFFDKVECQMCFFFDPELEREVMPQLPGLVTGRWCPIFVDVNVRGIDKATGMAESRRISASRTTRRWLSATAATMAMLRAAGVGVAMGNACDEALGAADHDGVGRRRRHPVRIGEVWSDIMSAFRSRCDKPRGQFKKRL